MSVFMMTGTFTMDAETRQHKEKSLILVSVKISIETLQIEYFLCLTVMTKKRTNSEIGGRQRRSSEIPRNPNNFYHNLHSAVPIPKQSPQQVEGSSSNTTDPLCQSQWPLPSNF